MYAVRRALAALVVVAFGVLSGGATLVRYSFDHAAARRVRGGTSPSPYESFLQDVRRATAPGDSIVIVAPTTDPPFYELCRWRAAYVLSGRYVLPLLTKRRYLHNEYLRTARYVLVWGRAVPAEVRATPVLQNANGVLLRND